jgi:hypothetical protein
MRLFDKKELNYQLWPGVCYLVTIFFWARFRDMPRIPLIPACRGGSDVSGIAAVFASGEGQLQEIDMPTYDYRCEFNGQIVEVKHRMSERVSTWGELCALAGIVPGDTPLNSMVEKLITGGQVVRSSSLGDAGLPTCGTGPCCGGGMCGMG